MAKLRKKNTRKTRKSKEFTKKLVKTKQINASTRIETCDESLCNGPVKTDTLLFLFDS